MNFEDALHDFGKALGNLKRAYGEKYNDGYYAQLQVIIDTDNDIAIIPTNEWGAYISCYRGSLDTSEE